MKEVLILQIVTRPLVEGIDSQKIMFCDFVSKIFFAKHIKVCKEDWKINKL